ncbi:MAG: hypothetical protein HY267_01015 [Deltaproteobacteria bacterium]|nr:hypothetical protein [Deltaproteobacteria bacterium]
MGQSPTFCSNVKELLTLIIFSSDDSASLHLTNANASTVSVALNRKSPTVEKVGQVGRVPSAERIGAHSTLYDLTVSQSGSRSVGQSLSQSVEQSLSQTVEQSGR